MPDLTHLKKGDEVLLIHNGTTLRESFVDAVWRKYFSVKGYPNIKFERASGKANDRFTRASTKVIEEQEKQRDQMRLELEDQGVTLSRYSNVSQLFWNYEQTAALHEFVMKLRGKK